MQHWHVCIAHAHIHVQCNIPACIPIVDAMLCLYSTDIPTDIADIHLQLEHLHGDNHLIANGKVLWQGYDAEASAAGFEVQFYNYVLAAIAPEVISIHAACVERDHTAIMLAGISGAGKSSSCTAALLDGASYLSDEFSLLNQQGEMQPFPRPLQWGKQRHPAFRHATLQQAGFSKFGFRFPDFEQRMRYNLFWFPPQISTQAVPLKAIIFPCYDKHIKHTHIQPVLRSQALMELSQHMHHRFAPAKCIQELNQRIPLHTPFLSVRFCDVNHAWQTIQTSLK